MATSGKRMNAAKELVDSSTLYSLEDAVALVKKTASAKFDESVDLAVKLGVDPKKSDQNVRGSAVLPAGLGKTVRVAVFASGANADAAREAGADLVGLEDIIELVKNGKIEFDACIAEPDAMKLVATVGRILGPRGLMPNPKTGTVRTDIAQAVKEAKAGKVDFKLDRAGIIHCNVGKVSFDPKALIDNISELIRALKRAQPAVAKGQYIRNVTLSTTMGPGVKVDSAELAKV